MREWIFESFTRHEKYLGRKSAARKHCNSLVAALIMRERAAYPRNVASFVIIISPLLLRT
jgi:CTP-dependent riboflavin kinase